MKWQPPFAGKSIRPAPAIRIPAEVIAVEVPLNPALAIAQRFGLPAKA
jgi:alpha-galactosidase